MADKKSKAIKQLEKQIKKLNARIDAMSREIKDLQDANATDQAATELREETWPDPKFSEGEVEIAEEMAEDAGEVEDILEKKNR